MRDSSAYYVILLLVVFSQCKEDLNCWKKRPRIPDMRLGPTPLFPWLGLLRVHLHEIANVRTAYTGLVLIKQKFAIAEAGDIVKVPKKFLIEESRVMFIIDPVMPWFCKVFDYMLHPEFDNNKYTIAIVELQTVNEDGIFRAQAICWPTHKYNTRNELYALEYVDEHRYLEKQIHKALPLDKALCDEFYRRAEAQNLKRPERYMCAFGINCDSFCIWDNGVVLASNASGNWVLVGFGTQGPGCAAPAKFINIIDYLPWIADVTDDYEKNSRKYAAQSAFGVGFRKKIKPPDGIKIHNLHEVGRIQRQGTYGGPSGEERGFKPAFHDRYLDRDVTIHQIDKNQIKIFLLTDLNDTYKFSDPCRQRKDLTYQEQSEFNAYETTDPPHTTEYWVTLYDMYINKKFTCILITVLGAAHANEPNLTIADWLTFAPEEEFMEHPKMLFKKHEKQNVFNRLKLKKINPVGNGSYGSGGNVSGSGSGKVPRPILEPSYLTHDSRKVKISNLYIKLKFSFTSKATLGVEVYGKKGEIAIGDLPVKFQLSRRMMEIKKQGERGDTGSSEARPDDPKDVYRHFYKPENDLFEYNEVGVPWMEVDQAMLNQMNSVAILCGDVAFVIVSISLVMILKSIIFYEIE